MESDISLLFPIVFGWSVKGCGCATFGSLIHCEIGSVPSPGSFVQLVPG